MTAGTYEAKQKKIVTATDIRWNREETIDDFRQVYVIKIASFSKKLRRFSSFSLLLVDFMVQ